jgi:hypothetical protein
MNWLKAKWNQVKAWWHGGGDLTLMEWKADISTDLLIWMGIALVMLLLAVGSLGFLWLTWRIHPAICGFIMGLAVSWFYRNAEGGWK